MHLILYIIDSKHSIDGIIIKDKII